MVSPSFNGAVGAHGGLAHHDRAIGLEHFELADALVVIAENLQQHIAAGAGREQNVVRFEQARVVRDEIFRLRGLELETAAERAGAAAQIEQIHLAVVMKNDPILAASLRPACRLSTRVPFSIGIDVAQRFHLHL